MGLLDEVLLQRAISQSGLLNTPNYQVPTSGMMGSHIQSEKDTRPYEYERAAVLPFGVNPYTGKAEAGVMPGILHSAINGLTAPGRAYAGQLPMWSADPVTGQVHTSEEANHAGLDATLFAATGGGLAVKAGERSAPAMARREGMGFDLSGLPSPRPDSLPRGMASPVPTTPLQMDAASRLERAKALGYDTSTPIYHGTTADFDAMAPSRYEFMKPDGSFDSMRGAFATASPEMANHYAFIRGRQYGDDGLLTMSDGANVLKMYGKNIAPSREAYDASKHMGFKLSPDGAEVLVTKPNELRSVNAEFNPAKSHLPGLLLANADSKAAPALLAGEQGQGDHGYHALPNNLNALIMRYLAGAHGGNQ